MRATRIAAITIAAACFMGGGGLSHAGAERSVPKEFRNVGMYELEKRVKIRDGVAFPVAIKTIRYEVYTDGITVRCYGEKGSAFTSFEIYRRDGISVSRGKGMIERMPGIQAKSVVGDVVRQMSLTEERMTLARFPALSDIVEITYSRRIPEEAHQ